MNDNIKVKLGEMKITQHITQITVIGSVCKNSKFLFHITERAFIFSSMAEINKINLRYTSTA
jgi:hypothetical protein